RRSSEFRITRIVDVERRIDSNSAHEIDVERTAKGNDHRRRTQASAGKDRGRESFIAGCETIVDRSARKEAEKQRREAEQRLEKATAASKDAARRAQSVAADAEEAGEALEDAKRTLEEAT